MNIPLIVVLVGLLCALLYTRTLQLLLADEKQEADNAFAKWRYAEHQTAAANTKIARLIGERAELQHKISVLQSELRRKHRRVPL